MYVTTSATAAGTGGQISVKYGESFKYDLSGTFSGSASVERSEDGTNWETVTSVLTAAASGELTNSGGANETRAYRWRCVSRASGTLVMVIKNSTPIEARAQLMYAGAKAGTTSGWVVNVGDNISLATCPASKTGSTMVVPCSGLKAGDKIVGFYPVGQIESAGGAVTLDVALRVMTSAAADVTDGAVASLTQIAVTADTAVIGSAYIYEGLDQVIGTDESYYFLVTATTAASTDIAIQGVRLLVVPA